MVLTDMPFHRPDAVASRYTLLKTPENGFTKEEEENKQIRSQEYAAFLKEKERQCGPDGFLDSSKFKHTFALKAEKREDIPSRPQSMTVVDLQLKKEKEEKEFQKRLKIIEDHMWQHKQEERELKRVEGDIIKNQRAVRRTIREFESAMTRKRLEETKKLNLGLEKYTRLQNNHIHKKEEQTKQRIEASLTASQSQKDMGRKLQLTTSHLARQFKSKATELELKKIEVERLGKEYETKIKTKEEEQFRLKQELADLAINLNMEAQKGRQMEFDVQRNRRKQGTHRIKDDRNADASLENKLGKSEGDSKAAEQNRRRLSADLTHTRGHLQVKQREEGRHLQDTEARLRTNISEQKALTEAAMNAELDLKARHLEKKMSEHESRRKTLATRSCREKKERTEAQEAIYAEKAKQRYAEVQRREHEDHLKFFQKMVSKGEEKEHNLYNQVRNAEYARQKQEQNVRRIQNSLNDLKKKNAQKIKQEMSDLEKRERELEQRLVREQAVLGKAHSEREDHYTELQKHREQLRKDKHILSEHEKEQARLDRIYHSVHSSHAEREESFITLQRHRDITREERHILDVHAKEHQRLAVLSMRPNAIKL